ncbi:DUF6098 family protein [Rhodococcus sp. (in: high G+C Gram-positive bacteria)]|uniref:DUF6098 family protein n=1 Tax=unclassified Rhodococcus (in: high G+C Gram-positive bacteria) TaxID=192944 RepID=UPI0019FB956C|nr:DUF6098 family protein [Rhodococcus sp. (in: high G+C Gram-positive bacteria)]MBF0663763.1 hypothetical protein [Rhodococcus sp. (in: high G+C Gram-positive bacteria)]
MSSTLSETHSVPGGIPLLSSLREVADFVAGNPDIHVRYSKGPAADEAAGPSRDYEAGVTLPGLSVTTLAPEPWWPGPLEDWLARRICKYGELGEEDGRFAWLLEGTVVGRGPDHEPLLTDIRPLARLGRAVLEEASRRYHERFAVGNDSRRDT